MTLHTLQPPPSALRAVLAALGSDAALGQPAAAVLRHSPGPLLPADPLAVYVLDGSAPRLAASRRTGWRFLIKPSLIKDALAHGPSRQEQGEAMAAAEVLETAEGHVFSHFTAGPYLDSTVRALRQARQLAHPAPARHQPRLLSLPSHYATALWLHSGNPGEDLLIPLAPAPLGVAAHQVYPAAELLSRLEHSPVAAPGAARTALIA